MTSLCPRCWGAPASSTAAVCGYCHGQGHVEDVALSPHFRLSELLVSETAVRKGIPNDPPSGFADRLAQVAEELLEPVREHFGPIHVNSGYRSPEVNEAIGGSATSAHMQAFAADIKPLEEGVTLKAIVDWVIANEDLHFDQVIFEGSWVHLGLYSPSGEQRRQALQMFGGKYAPYDPNDPRVSA